MGVMEARRRIMLNQPHLIDASGNPISFNTDMAAKMGVKAYFSPVQEGSGDPSPSNVRPITGWTGCEVTRCGKNLFDISSVTYGKWTINSGVVIDPALYGCITKKIPVKVGQTVIVSIFGEVYSKALIFYNIDGSFNNRLYSAVSNASMQHTSLIDGFFALQVANGGDRSNPITSAYLENAKIVMVIGESVTAYEPYSGSSYPVTFPSEAGTLYGGYVDYEKGEVVATHKMLTVTGNEGITYTQFNGALFNSGQQFSDSKQSSYLYGVCSAQYANWQQIIDTAALVKSSIYRGIQFNNVTTKWGLPEVTSAALVAKLQEMNEAGTPLQVCYELATPIHYPIAPQIIKSLKGANTIWSDTNGNVSLKYWKH